MRNLSVCVLAILVLTGCGHAPAGSDRSSVPAAQSTAVRLDPTPVGGRYDAVVNPAERDTLFKKLAKLPVTLPAARIIPKLLNPSVVNIVVERNRARRNPVGSAAKGSGFILSADGYIGTNFHVVEDGHNIRVTTMSGREYPATIHGVDRKTDLAVLKVDSKNLIPVRMGNSEKLEVGEVVIAIGNAFGNLGHTVTLGIVSAIGRTDVAVISHRYRYENFIQTDAAINKGNSGGPLINMRGEVVGVNTAILSGSGGFEGVGLAAPINQARFVFNRLMETGKVVRGWLGIDARDLTPALVRRETNKKTVAEALAALGLQQLSGVLVNQVNFGTPAAKGTPPMKRGDLIIGYDGDPITRLDDFRNRVAKTPVNQVVKIQVLRDKKPMEIQIKIGEQPSD